MKYKKRPVVIEAFPADDLIHWASRDWNKLPRWSKDAYEKGNESEVYNES